VTFSLTNQYGKKITENDLRGRYLLVYFGFTGCGDTCPLQLRKLTQAVAQYVVTRTPRYRYINRSLPGTACICGISPWYWQ
jgi:cytochrome oxidase Cu insertion factor (SCO1/SenC/PrrC family)